MMEENHLIRIKKILIGLLFVIMFANVVAADSSVSKKVNLDGEQITERSLRDGMYAFLMKYKKKHLDEQYSNHVINAFWNLLNRERTNVKEVLYFMAICSVESNFDQNVPCKYGVGISQVVYRVHKKYITELGVTKDEVHHSPSHNIFVGYNIFCCYLRSTKGVFTKASTRYNGGATKGYATKVQSRFQELVSTVKSLQKRGNENEHEIYRNNS